MTKPLLVDQLHHHLGALAARGISLLPLVERLAAHAHMAASTANAQAFDELLREDLPKGFFTTRTP